VTVSVVSPYARRQAPGDLSLIPGFLDQELQNVQRAIDASYSGAIVVRKTGNDDDTKRIQGALKSGRTTFIADGDYNITDDLLLASNSQVILAGPAVTITQKTPGKGVFKRVGLDNSWIHYNGGQIIGPGVWDPSWLGIDGHDERGEKVYGCTNSGSTLAKIKNFGLAGMVVLGGSALRFLSPEVEGTHALGTPLIAGSSQQFGYLVGHDLTYGAFSDIQFWGASAFNTNFGGNSFMNIPGSTGLLLFAGSHFYQIIGQHGFYCGTGNSKFPFYTAHDCHFLGWKLFSGVIDEILTGSDVSDFNIWNCGDAAVEFGVSGSGYIARCHASGKADNCARGMLYDGDIRQTDCEVISTNATQRHLYVANSISPQGPRGCKWDITGDTSADYSILINSSTSARNTLIPRVERPGAGLPSIYVAAGSVTIQNPRTFDDTGHTTYSLQIAAGASVKLAGVAEFKGYNTNAIRADGTLLLHATLDVDSDNTAFYDNGENVLPVVSARLGAQSTSTTDVPIWKYTPSDESSHIIEATLTGKLAGSGEIAMIKTLVMVQRDGGVTSIPAVANNPKELVFSKTAGFTGVYSWAVSGTAVRLLVNSGAASTIDWEVEVRQVRRI
jgi:hypothetical protein